MPPGVYIAEEIYPWVDTTGKIVPATGGTAIGQPSRGGQPTGGVAGSGGSGGAPPSPHPVQPTSARGAERAVAPRPATPLPRQLEATGTYRPSAFQPAIRAHPNAELTRLAHQHGGLIAESTSAANSTRPETTRRVNEARLQSAASAAKQPSTTAHLAYHIYKRDVHLKLGQVLAYTPGKGYYARTAKPGPQKHPVQPTARRELTTLNSDEANAKRRRPDLLEKLVSAIGGAFRSETTPHPLADAHAKLPPKQWQSSKGREQYAARYFGATLGLNRFQAAAIAGNFAIESYAYARPGKPHLVANLGQYGGGGGFGIAQWTLPQRKEALQDFARQHGLSRANFGLQLAYAAHELATDGESKKYGRLLAKGTIEALRNAKSPGEAVAIVMVGFEHPGGQDGQQWRHVPPFPSVVKLARESPPPNTLLPVPSIANDASGYSARLKAATRIAHDKSA